MQPWRETFTCQIPDAEPCERAVQGMGANPHPGLWAMGTVDGAHGW